MNAYMNVYASLSNICKRFADENPSYQREVMDFDDNVDTSEYPKKNLIGSYQFDYEEDTTMITGTCVFPVSTTETADTHLVSEIIGKLAMFVREQTKHPLYDYESGQIIGLMTAQNSLMISPMTKTTNRQFKYLLQSFGVDRTASFQP